MRNAVLNAIRRHRMCTAGSHLLLAVSGGADSIALLTLLNKLAPQRRWRLSVAHLNHRSRGSASDADQAFVRAQARRLRLPFHTASIDVAALAAKQGLSFEMAARDARYQFLARTAARIGADAVATAHNADDQAETLLLRFARGTGTAGLAGIPWTTTHHGIRIIRPLLGVYRSEILAFLARHKTGWREDTTNADRDFLRNRVRHDLLPALANALNPRLKEALLRTADILRADNEWLESLTASHLAHCTEGEALLTEPLHDLPLAARRRVIKEWLIRRGLGSADIDFDAIAAVDTIVTGRRVDATTTLGGGFLVRRRNGRLSQDNPLAHTALRISLRTPGNVSIPLHGLEFRADHGTGIIREKGTPGELPARAAISRAAVGRRALVLRSWRPGDRMRPFGMHGSKKIHDILIDAKVPREKRGAIPVLECGGEIIWLPGARIASGWELPKPDAPAILLTLRKIP